MRAEYAREAGDPRMALTRLEEPLLTKADLSRVQCPTCGVLAGQNDIIEEAHTREIAACIADSRLFILEHGGSRQLCRRQRYVSWAVR